MNVHHNSPQGLDLPPEQPLHVLSVHIEEMRCAALPGAPCVAVNSSVF
jgi:hypothetical protein